MRRLIIRLKGSITWVRTLAKKKEKTESTANEAEAPKDGNETITAAQAPVATTQLVQQPIHVKTTSSTLRITLKNQSQSSSVYCFVTGQAIDYNYALVLLQADGQSLYFPTNPSHVGSPLTVNCAISLGAAGSSRTITIPRISAGRIWFSIGTPLKFLLNPGGNNTPGLVEPSATNPSDPNYNIKWSFAEFTYNQAQMYANISFVDFVSLPIALSLTNTSGSTQTVAGLPNGGLTSISSQLEAQTRADGCKGWANLVVRDSQGSVLRILSPNNDTVLRPGDFGTYYDTYVNAVLARYGGGQTFSCAVNGQTYTGHTNPASTAGAITVGPEVFARPTTKDIFSSNTGPFVTGGDALRNAMIPQLAAAFNRSTLLAANAMPAPKSAFYQNAVTNHYSRIVHGVVAGGKGYAFPYDDVPPSGGADQSGFVSDGSPASMTMAVGSPS